MTLVSKSVKIGGPGTSRSKNSPGTSRIRNRSFLTERMGMLGGTIS